MRSLVRPLLIAVGMLSVGLGVIGIFLPIMPTTPFLLLAAYCFARSSQRMHRWLVTHPHLGCYIEGFLYGGGVPRRAKRAALLTLWPAITVSCVIVIVTASNRAVAIAAPVAMVITASIVSAYIVTRPTVEDDVDACGASDE